MSDYNAAQITITHTSLLSLLQSLSGYSLLTRATSYALTAQELQSLTSDLRMVTGPRYIASA
jgi:hypothetical protein